MNVLLFLAEGFEDLEAISILDIMGWTEYREWVPTVKVTTTGFRPEIRSRFGLTVQPDILLDQIKPSEYAALESPVDFTVTDSMKPMMTVYVSWPVISMAWEAG